MTQAEKAKAYDELFVKAQQIYNKENDVLIIHTIEDLFPELAESEDEKIRKEIISFIQDDINEINLKVSGDYDDRDKEDIAHQNWCKKAISWLEKQGEQKPSWSEEDENMLKDIKKAVIDYWPLKTQYILLGWLKSLKSRVQPQPKYEWSEED